MKKTLLIIVLGIAVLYGAYLYMTRPIETPTVDVQSVTDVLRPMSDVTWLYRIATGTIATFEMNELLNGNPKLVVGTTTEVAGDIGITNNHIKLGEIKLDARTLITDNERRNGAINRIILKTTEPGNEYVTVLPLATDFEGEIILGTPVTFKATTELTISGVTRRTDFDVTMTITEDKITGIASTKIKRSDFSISIPNLSFIANVDDEFPIRVEVVAERVEK